MANKRTLGFSPADLRKKFRAGMTVRDYRDKEAVFSQGDTADAVFYIHSGTVKLTAVSTRRKKAIIAFLQRGSFFGEGCLISADLHGEINRAVQYHSTAKGKRGSHAQARPEVCIVVR
jgi:CRP-like cAMP-binding protein